MRILLLFCTILWLRAQLDAQQWYRFLYLPTSPVVTALGGMDLTHYEDPSGSAYFNPALLNDSTHQQITWNFIDYFAGIVYGYVSYQHNIPEVARIQGAIKHVYYGNFTRADVYGNQLGRFNANDIEFIASFSRNYGKRLQWGVNLNFIYSQIESFWSAGFAMDFGLLYRIEEEDFNVAVVVNNFGYPVRSYQRDGSKRRIPLNIAVGLRKRVPHTPFRLSVTAHSLNQPNLISEAERQRDQQQSALFPGQETVKRNYRVDNIFRHLIFALEIIPSESFHLRFSYNHQRRKELKALQERFSLTGFALGLSLRLYRFYLSYAYAGYNAPGGLHHLGVRTYLHAWKKSHP